ncbi:MAG: ABC-type transport auxiliary lipoprotein family protein [Deltaproteobacteria bacterium]|nr:ABC-type transport auxiliary lipoprotein family protein [Deltaproteobacteria bacterium]
MRQLLMQAQCHGKRIKIFCFIMVALSLIIIGCAGSGKPQYEVESYLLSYSVPSWEKPDKLSTSLKFNRFSIAAAYNSANMVFRKDSYSLDSFNYSRWAVNPADMIADSLLRDVRESGLFQAVFSRHETDEARFVISGSVEEFFLRMGKSDKTAVISISVLLKDTREKEIGKSIMFQKKYLREEPLQESSPQGYCQAASLAMRVISEQITNDIYAAVKTKVQSTAGNP